MQKALLFALLLCFASPGYFKKSRSEQNIPYQFDDQADFVENDSGVSSSKNNPAPFRAGNAYTYVYNSQIATGLVSSDISAEPGIPQQKAITRMQAVVNIEFQSDRRATLQLKKIKVGELNDIVSQPDCVKPMSIFKPKQIPNEKEQILEMPCYFIYIDGVIDSVRFQSQDEHWSKNIKRAVLNMIQLNLKKNNAQGLRVQEDFDNGQMNRQEEEEQNYKSQASFAIPETTLEGECLVLYTIDGQQSEESNKRVADDEELFNVTKSINFKDCRRMSDVGYGFQTEQTQQSCAQYPYTYYKQQMNQKDAQIEERQQPNPFERCDAKEVKENKLSRSTIMRFVLRGSQNQPEKYGIKRTEVTSQYVLKSLKAETGQYGSAMQAIAAAELVFRSVRPTGKKSIESEQDYSQYESLLFSNQASIDEKRFYMFGDDEFTNNNTPFKEEKGKVAHIEQSLRKLAQTIENHHVGIEVEAPLQLQQLAENLRKFSMNELKQIDRAVSSRHVAGSNSGGQTIEQLYVDAIAIAGTRNTIALLVEKIRNQEISTTKSSQSLIALQNLPAPSDLQVKLIQKLCQSEVCQTSKQLKQACWLVFGAMVNELCQHKTQRVAQMTVFGRQSGFKDVEVCSENDKESYREAMTQLYNSAQNTYEKYMALKVFGNAGIDTSIITLEKIIKDVEEVTILRTTAIDCLRRMRVQMRRRIQNLLLPIFVNNREQPEVRMASLAMLMKTVPGPQIIDQIGLALMKERCQDVFSFAYNYLKSLSKTRNSVLEHQAIYIQNVLKLVNTDEKTLKSSGLFQIPVFSEDEHEGVFLNVIAAFSDRQMMPVHLSTRLNSLLNDEYQTDDFVLSFSQQNLDSTIQKLSQKVSEYIFQQGRSTNRANRAQRLANRNQETPRDIYSMLGIKSRHSFVHQQSLREVNKNSDDRTFAAISIRILDVDQLILPISTNEGPAFLQTLMAGQIPNAINQLSKLLSGRHIRNVLANNRMEKRASIPSSIGLLLNTKQSFPLIMLLDLKPSVSLETPSLSSPLGVKAQIQGQFAVNFAHVQKIEAWLLEMFVSGVQSVQSIEMNLPLNVELNSNMVHGLQAKIKMPQTRKIQLFGLHTIPATYTTVYNDQTYVLKEKKIKTIHNPMVEQFQREIHSINGRSCGLPFVIKGHYYRPSKPTNYKQMVQMLMAAENQLHLMFQPNEQTPREVLIRVQASQFEKMQQPHKPQFEEFYGGSQKFEPYSSDDSQDFEGMGSHSESHRNLISYVKNKYQSGSMYKHGLKVSVQTVGGQKEAKGVMEIQLSADSKFRFQKLEVDMEKRPIDDSEKWTLKANAQILRPESVSSVQQLSQLQSSDSNKNLVVLAKAEWGKPSDRQHINLRIRGEQAMKRQWRKIEQLESEINKFFKRRTNFLNKYDIIADYNIKPFIRNIVSYIYNAMKAQNYWNSKTESTVGQIQQGQGVIRSTLIINPITQRQANVSIRTPWEMVQIQAMELPIQLRPFPLVRSSEQSTHSAIQLINRFTTTKRAECSVDGRRVSTFDDVKYRAPLSKCYSLLAKDCSGLDEEPKFAVLMKALDSKNPSGWKKIKLVTPIQSIVCQPKTSSSRNNVQISCKVNGESIGEQNEMEESDVEYNNDQKSDVTIHSDDVSVRFNGEKAWIKMSTKYKNSQCGLCGHYNDEQEDEWRMGNNELTKDLSQFHRSYSIQQDEECTPNERDTFYSDNKHLFWDNKMKKTKNQRDYSSSSSSEEYDGLNAKWTNMNEQSEWDDQSFEGDDHWFNYGESKYLQRNIDPARLNQSPLYSGKLRSNMDRGRTRLIQQKPLPHTMVMEIGSTKVCFSMEPVNQCPRGTYPSNKANSSDGKMEVKQISVKFTCLPRYDDQTHRLLRQARAGVVLEMNQQSPSLTETVYEPIKCVSQ